MTEKHTHKLKRITHRNGEKVYFCVLNCTFKINVKLSLGKRNICWRCGVEFPMNEYSMRLAKPHCPKCHQYEGGVVTQEVLETAKDPIQALRDRLNSTAKVKPSGLPNVAVLDISDDKEDDLL